jgi:CHAT domain-containing protein
VSYTPLLSALLSPSIEGTPGFEGILAVSEPSTLPGTEIEVKAILEQAKSARITWLNSAQATRESVLKAMETHNWVHLACHASQNLGDPTRSAYQLHGGDSLELLTVMQKSFGHGGFAFLSACQTATGDEKVPDESVHLAAGMIAAGDRSIVATMWSIQDDDAPFVARAVYSRLFGKYTTNGAPNPLRASLALHEAMGELRERIGEREFGRWHLLSTWASR